MDKNDLKTFGMCEYEAKVIIALKQNGKLRGCQIWRKADIPPSKLYETLLRLQDKKLIEKEVIHPSRKVKENSLKLIEQGFEYGLKIRISGITKAKIFYKVNGNMEKFLNRKIRKLEKTKDRILRVWNS